MSVCVFVFRLYQKILNKLASDRLSIRIDSICSGLTKTAQTKSTPTRDKANGTLVVLNFNKLKENVANTKVEIDAVSITVLC